MTLGTNHPGLGLKDRKILIVSSDRSMILSLSEILATEGYQISEAESDSAALAIYPDLEPDVVLLHVGLPGGRAFELCRLLKRGINGIGAPILLLTSKSDPEEAVEGLAAGAVDYLSKPFRQKEILARIRVHLLNRLRLAHLSREDKAKNRLLCMAAHDLRNPLVSIRALTNMLRTGAVGDVTVDQRDLLDTVYDASQSMLDLVNELLDVSVFEAGELKLSLSPISLTDLVSTTVKLNNAAAAEKGSIILWDPVPIEGELQLDVPKIRQVLNNLLGNAIKFSPSGSNITVLAWATPSHCVVAVRDQGPGIPESERAQLFKDFGRTSVKPTGGESSTGLGLSICLRIMHAHDGDINAENLPGGGAEFRIRFPLRP